MQGCFITGTDTDVGKTLAAAWLMLHLRADYWKPVQCGLEPATDRMTVQRLTALPARHVHAETYALDWPLSPHEAARRQGVEIRMSAFVPPKSDRPLIVEGAGGLLVPLNEESFMIDLAARLALPVILVCRSGLGTINHTLLSLEALKRRGLPLAGLIVNGEKAPHNRAALAQFGQVPILAEIDHLTRIDRASLLAIRPETDLQERLRGL